MDRHPKWEFAPTNGGDDDGFSDAFIETFTGDYETYLAREIIQNSIDARFDNSIPVEVKFDRYDIETISIPCMIDLQNIFQKCLDYWPSDKKVIAFFSRAITLAKQDKVSVLKISDFNTTGLRGGDYEKQGERYCLVKTQGASSKQEEKGGSFGIGKGAPFAASAFRLVYYSTLTDTDENIFHYSNHNG